MSLKGNILVFGGGIAGMQASLDLAESGFKVFLIETGTAIGGIMAQLDKTFPTNDCSMCIMSPKLVEVGRHPNISILTNADLEKFNGNVGNFTVTLKQRTNYVINDTCTGCGTCAELCPIEVLDEYNANLGTRKAVYLSYPQAIPKIYTIDPNTCIGCGLCKNTCPTKAIDYVKTDRLIEIKIGSIIIATGSKLYDPSKLTNFGYGSSPNIITSIEFERLLSATGPFMGHVLRLSDGKAPKKLAFIQCVGSRNRKIGREFCSAACCMYAMKEAIIARDHDEELEITIFYMDIRAFGKGFEDYYNRAEEQGIKFIRSRPASVTKKGEKLEILYEDDREQLNNELFDMVVLSTGFDIQGETNIFKEKIGIELNKWGFIKTDSLKPLQTNIDGVFVCGIVAGPKDIPDTVAQASAAASKASLLIYEHRGELIEIQELPDELDLRNEEPRVGVFLCHCGINIGSVIDIPEVVEFAGKVENVVHVERNLYTCSQDTQEHMIDIIKEKKINRVVVASCTPRTHEPLFQNTIRSAKINKYLFQLANIREQDSWVHKNEPEKATEKAKGIVKSAIYKSALLRPIEDIKVKIIPIALVIGGGITGITAALGLANQGFKTHLIEKTDKLGGIMRRILHLSEIESMYDPQIFLQEKIKEVKENENIVLHLNSELTELEGYIGNYHSVIKTGEKLVDLDSGVLIVATGAKEHQPTEYLYGKNNNVITELELEEKLSKREIKGKNFVFIQCVGSRNEINPYCSRICCSEAIKNAIHLKQEIPDANVFVLYRDIRTYAFKEESYNLARDLGILFINYDLEDSPIVYDDKGSLKVSITDKILNRKLILSADYVILSVAIEALQENSTLADILKVPVNENGFFLEAHMKLRPVEFASEGLFVCGLAHSPKFIEESIAQAEAAVSRALTILSKDEMEIEGIISQVDEDKCIACGMCITICPFDAIKFNEDKSKVIVNAVKCHGCGLCAGECPERAIELNHYLDSQFYAQIENIFKEEEI